MTSMVELDPPADGATRRKALFWAMVPVGLLTAMLIGWAVMITIAVRDPGFSLEPDYYRKALGWDAQQAQRAENARLGWRVELAQIGSAQPGVPAAFEIRARDAAGAPIAGAHASIECFYNARAALRLSTDLHDAGDGVYRVTLPIRHAGLWEFRLTLRRGTATFTDVVRRDVSFTER